MLPHSLSLRTLKLSISSLHGWTSVNSTTLCMTMTYYCSRVFFCDIIDPASCLLSPPGSTAFTSRLISSQTFPKVYTHTHHYCSSCNMVSIIISKPSCSTIVYIYLSFLLPVSFMITIFYLLFQWLIVKLSVIVTFINALYCIDLFSCITASVF